MAAVVQERSPSRSFALVRTFFVPNTFSPNGDGSNDVFYLRGTGLFRVKALRVFNRWGEVVFEKKRISCKQSCPWLGWKL